jgi:glycosyltransferase involved in cell wall biosynthesis
LENNKKTNWLTKECQSALVSVIIPTYNREGYLQETVQSVISQTYRPIECIIVDDGSTDDTKALINKITRQVDAQFSIKYIYQVNAGSQVARNTGTRASTGEFIQYLDSDDLLYPQKIQKQVAFLKNNVDCDAVFGDWEKGPPENKEFIEARESDDMICQLLTERVIHTLAFLYRRAIVYKIGEWDVIIKRNQEIDFEVRGLLEGAVYRYQPQNCGLWRIHNEDRIGNSTGSKEILHFFKKWEKLLEKRAGFSERLKKGVANVLFWAAVKEAEKPDKLRIFLLRETVRLDPAASFYNTAKMRFMVRFFGPSLALRLWFFWYKRHIK